MPGYLFLGKDASAQRALAESFSDPDHAPLREHKTDLHTYDKNTSTGVDLLHGHKLVKEIFPGNLARDQHSAVHMRCGGWFDTKALANELVKKVKSVRTNARVQNLIWKHGRVAGVQLEGGETLEAGVNNGFFVVFY